MTLIAIGGGEDKVGESVVLKRVLEEGKGTESRICVITTATGYPEEVGQTYRDAFARLGATCDVAHITTAKDADSAAFLKTIEEADIVFFSGGDQTKLSAVFNETDCLSLLAEKHRKGDVIAGTSAGAAVMSQLMITGGRPENGMVKGKIQSETGFGLASDIIFDTHFMNRDRLPRLYNLVASDPRKIGCGLDEDTGVILKDDQTIEVIGNQTVTIVDGRNLTDSTFAKVKEGEVFKAEGFAVHTLKPGEKQRLDKFSKGKKPTR